MPELTPIQQKILKFIKSCMVERHLPPTMREIAEFMGYRSDNAAYQHLQALQRKGVIELDGRSRGIRLSEPLGLPVVGRVAAGSPILAEQNIDTHVPLNPNFFRPRADFMLRVKGMSMMEAGIFDSDLLAIKKTSQAEQSQIVVARLEDEVTVKYFKRRQNIVTLLPANPEFEPIKVDLRRQPFAIEGVMVGLVRRGEVRKSGSK